MGYSVGGGGGAHLPTDRLALRLGQAMHGHQLNGITLKPL